MKNILLNVPYSEKDLAKAKGAKWNPDIKSWYVDDVKKLQNLAQWLNGYNIICENLYMLKMKHVCWKCRKNIEVVLLATDKSYFEEEGYKINTNIQLFTYVTKMPEKLKNYIQEFAYYPSFSKTIDTTYYVNHCKYCYNIQGDNFLHERPNQSFYKKLCYKDSEPICYAKINNSFCVPLQAELPYYDEMSSSMKLFIEHMETGIENRASLNINQKLINKLFDCSIKETDINISGL